MALLSKSTFVLLAALVAVMFIVPLAKVPSETHSIVAEEMATQGLEDLELARPGGLSSPARNLPEGHDSKEKRLRRDLELDPMPAFRNPCFSPSLSFLSTLFCFLHCRFIFFSQFSDLLWICVRKCPRPHAMQGSFFLFSTTDTSSFPPQYLLRQQD